MKKAVMKAVVAMAAVALVSPAARAAEATVGADLSSAYVFRGDTLNDGLVAQPSLEVAGLPVTLGVWGNLDIDDAGSNDGDFSEVDFYGSYGLPVEGVDASVGYCEYIYGDDAFDREVSLSVGVDAPLAPTVGIYYGVDGMIEESLYVDLGISHELELAEGVGLGLGALIGYSNPDSGEDGFKQYEVSAALSYNIVSASVKYIGQVDDEVLVDVEDGGFYDADVVGTIGISHAF